VNREQPNHHYYPRRGSYTPVFDDRVNCDVPVASSARWMRIGNFVQVAVYCTVVADGAGLTQATFSVPFSEGAFTIVNQAVGSGAALTAANAILPVLVLAYGTDEVSFRFVATANESHAVALTFMYEIVP
jgi:hypothetical protein